MEKLVTWLYFYYWTYRAKQAGFIQDNNWSYIWTRGNLELNIYGIISLLRRD